MLFPLSVATPLSDELETDIFFPSCPVLVECRELLADFVLLDVIDFNVILGMDGLAQHYASLDCREKVVISNFPNDDKFWFRGDESSMPQNLISAIIARKMLRRRIRGYLTVVRRVEAETGADTNVSVVCEFPDVFSENCQDYHQKER